MEPKKFTLIISCYKKYLSGIENVDEEEIKAFIENYHEPLPKNSIKKALSELQIGENMYNDWWHINEGKLLAMIPEYHREIKLIRLN
jgi:hypothetical protein